MAAPSAQMMKMEMNRLRLPVMVRRTSVAKADGRDMAYLPLADVGDGARGPAFLWRSPRPLSADEAVRRGRQRRVVRDDEHGDAIAAAGVWQQLQHLLPVCSRAPVGSSHSSSLGFWRWRARWRRVAARRRAAPGKLAVRFERPTLARHSAASSESGQICEASSTFSSAVRLGTSCRNWNTKPMSARAIPTNWSSLAPPMSRLSTTTRPLVAVSMPPKMLSAGLLAPDAPKITASSPRSTSKLAPSSARTSPSPEPYTLVTSENSM